MTGSGRWDSASAWREIVDADLPPLLRTRCLLLVLRSRIERVAATLPPAVLGQPAPSGRPAQRLWALVALSAVEDRVAAGHVVRQARRIYGQSSEYLHSRRAALVPSPAELATWLASVEALEVLAAGVGRTSFSIRSTGAAST